LVMRGPLGVVATSLREFRDGLAEVHASALFYHVVEARYRLGRDPGDFTDWAEHGLGRSDLAARLARIDAQVGSLERLRDRCLTVLDDALGTGSYPWRPQCASRSMTTGPWRRVAPWSS